MWDAITSPQLRLYWLERRLWSRGENRVSTRTRNFWSVCYTDESDHNLAQVCWTWLEILIDIDFLRYTSGRFLKTSKPHQSTSFGFLVMSKILTMFCVVWSQTGCPTTTYSDPNVEYREPISEQMVTPFYPPLCYGYLLVHRRNAPKTTPCSPADCLENKTREGERASLQDNMSFLSTNIYQDTT